MLAAALAAGLTSCVSATLAPVVHNGQPYGGPYRMPEIKTGERVVRVNPGDTVSGIAVRFKVPYGALVRRNSLSNPDKIYIGQRLVLPAPGSYTSSRQTASKPSTQRSQPRQTAKVHRVPRDFAHIPIPEPKPGTSAARGSQPTVLPPKRNDPPRQVAKAPSKPEPAPPPRSGFAWPVSGPIVLGYGPKAGGLHNDGINIGASRGTPVHAAEAGVVTYVGNELRGFGNLTLIKHQGGYITAYAHTAKPKVSRGDTVKRGQVIGTVDSSGAVDKPQLHFEIRKGLKARNPMDYLPNRSEVAGS